VPQFATVPSNSKYVVLASNINAIATQSLQPQGRKTMVRFRSRPAGQQQKTSNYSFALALVLSVPSVTAFTSPPLLPTATTSHTKLSTATTSPPAKTVGSRIQINEAYPGLKRVNANPDVFIIENFLDEMSCQDLIDKAKEKGTSRSPVAYAGWTDDIKDLLGLAASGPVTWFAILGAWYEAQGDENASILSLVLRSFRNYAGLFVVAAALIAGFTKFRADGLQSLRTSSSTTLDDLSQMGARKFVSCAEDLFSPSPTSGDLQPASYFEAPTVIQYEKDQSLAPHYDANRSADVEDKNRGGQTLATLIVYLNDVTTGGTTRFGKLPATNDERQVKGESNLNIIPQKGDALLFFPADQNGMFDERTEHEGCPAVDEKWIARIWRHADRVNPPFGLSDESMKKFL
jgi:hypothetical protein